MLVKSRRQEHADNTRKALMRVARSMFAKRGYAATSTEEVVRRARVTRGALYHHFRDKRDLYLAVLHQEEQRLLREIAGAAGPDADPWQRLVRGCDAFLDACLDPAVRQIVLTDGMAVLGWEGFRDLDQGYFLGGLKAALEAAMDAGFIEVQKTAPLADILFASLHEAAMFIAHAGGGAEARDDASRVVSKIMNGLRRPA